MIKGLGQNVRLTDRFFLGEPEMRGFDIRGVGPRVIRTFYDTTTGKPYSSGNQSTDDALGGNKYYQGRLELELPLGNGGKELGLRPSIFMDAGAVWGGRRPATTSITEFTKPDPTDPTKTIIVGQFRDILDSTGHKQCINTTSGVLTQLSGAACPTGTTAYGTTIPPFDERYYGNSAKPRLAIGFGVNWNSPFGPFRIDIAKALLKEPGDQDKLFSFNVGTQF